MPKQISIAIIEDDTEIRETLAQYLANDAETFSTVITFNSVESILASITSFEEFILILDINLPGISGVDGIFHLKQKWPSCEIIMLSVQNDSASIFNSICAGATGYIEKGTSMLQIKESIITLSEGGSPISPAIARKIFDYFKPSNHLEEHLTARELQVVNGLVDGLSYKLIAARLEVSIDTIRKYIRKIYGKLHINSKGELLAKYHHTKGFLKS